MFQLSIDGQNISEPMPYEEGCKWQDVIAKTFPDKVVWLKKVVAQYVAVTLPICPTCGSMGIFDDHVDTDFGPDTASIYQCENDECGRWFYVAETPKVVPVYTVDKQPCLLVLAREGFC